MRPGLAVAGILLLATALAAIESGGADFAAAAGFSGRFGFDCTACHVPPGYGEPASLVVDGLPSAWDAGTTYLVTVRVEGGPPAVPVLQPQGGFEADADQGHFETAPGMEGLTRNVGTALTYTPEGTLMRTWDMHWVAPTLVGLDAAPAPVGFWFAGVSANGNHIIATNASDLGEHGDQVATATATIPPSRSTLAAWNASPLAPIDTEEAIVQADGDRAVVRGSHRDPLATAVAWSVDGGEWQRRDTGPTWSIEVDGLRGGKHDVQVRSEGAGRMSLAAHVLVEVDESFLDKVTPAPTVWWVGAGLLTAAWLRRPT